MTSLPSSPPPITRKRSRADYLSADLPSSDPVFSSDDLEDASIEHYDAPRRKKHYHGSWWQSSQSSQSGNRAAVRAKSHLERNLDSGVWMGSDDSEQSTSSLPDLPAIGSLQYPRNDLADFVDKNEKQLQPEARAAPVPEEELQRLEYVKSAKQIIDACCTYDQFTVNLSTLKVKRLPGDILKPLDSLVAVPRTLQSTSTPDPATYRDLTAQLEVFMSRMDLKQLPPELWELSRIHILSLHSNKLARISPNIAKLKSLKSMELQHNDLHWLPWEMLILRSASPFLRHPMLYGNPMLMEKDPTDHESPVYKSHEMITAKIHEWMEHFGAHLEKHHREGIRMYFIASTPIAYLSTDGTPHFSSTVPPSLQTALDNFLSAEIPTARFPDGPIDTSKSCRSLLEQALAATSRHCTSNYLLDAYGDVLPPGIERAIRIHLQETEDEGGRECSVCSRSYLIPRAEWVEYWIPPELYGRLSIQNECFLPHLRRACSWKCADEVVQGFRTGKSVGKRGVWEP